MADFKKALKINEEINNQKLLKADAAKRLYVNNHG